MQLRLRLRPVGRFWAKTNNSEAQRAAILEEQRDRHKLLVREALSYLLVAICEDLPMGTLTTVPTPGTKRVSPPAASALRLGSPLPRRVPHRRRDWARPVPKVSTAPVRA